MDRFDDEKLPRSACVLSRPQKIWASVSSSIQKICVSGVSYAGFVEGFDPHGKSG